MQQQINKLTSCNSVTIIAGPCSIEDAQQMDDIASVVNDLSLTWLRGGAFKPRSNLHSFQGLGIEGLQLLKEVSSKYNLKSISEITASNQIQNVLQYCDAVQIGTRNMHNYQLLEDIGIATAQKRTPVLFKRGMAATINEWLCASEYITQHNDNVVLCERGLRTFEDATRFTLDISAVPVVHKQSNLPICVDVSHAAGNSEYVISLACAAVAAGADAIMVEVHPDPKNAKSDGPQQLNVEQFKNLICKVENIARALGKSIS